MGEYATLPRVMVDTVLSAQSLTHQVGNRLLFKDLSFSLAPATVLWVQGGNGAGKTSLLRLLAGLAQPASGQVSWQGRAIRQCGPEYAQALHYLAHRPAVKAGLTVQENLALAVELFGQRANAAQRRQAMAHAGLSTVADRLGEQLSAGQMRRVALARLLLRPAQVWLLDEPLTALDAAGHAWLMECVREQVANGGVVVLSSHQALNWPAELAVQSLMLDNTQEIAA